MIPASATDMAVHYSSVTPEWYTPEHIVSRVIQVLGTIDLDPCSNSHTSPIVPALKHFTQTDNGLAHLWHGRVYMNPPYGRVIAKWISHLATCYRAGHVTEAIALTPSRTDTKWFRALHPAALCFIAGRLQFSNYGDNAPFPSVAIYLGNNLPAFVNAFGDIGDIYQPLSRIA